MMKTGLFVSRNKDNTSVVNFKERRKAFFIEEYPHVHELAFKQFVEEGLPGETCRFYVSVNDRDMESTKRDLICAMVSDSNFNLLNIKAKTISLANMPKNASTHKWLFDFDSKDTNLLENFLNDLPEWEELKITPNGFHIIVNKGFDTRELLKKYPRVELKRDDMYLFNYLQKGNILDENKNSN